MGRHQQVARLFGLAACLAFGGGCIHVHTDADGKVKAIHLKPSEPADTPRAPVKPPEVIVDSSVKPASATVPAPNTAALAKLGKAELPKGAASELGVAWQNKVAYLPNPVDNGNQIPGIVGQMWLFAPGYQTATANGKLIVEMFDNMGDGTRIGGWTLDKDALKKLVSKDERFGKCYTLFLPWPDYKGQATRVKLMARFEGENAYPLYAPESIVTLDPQADNTATIRHSQTIAGGPIGAGFMGPPPNTPPAPVYTPPPLNPLPVGGRNAATNATPDLSGLPPLVITSPGR